MRRGLALALAAAAVAGCNFLTGDFSLSGTVDIAPRLRDRAPKTNAMLFVVAENEGGVPVAVRRIVNPEFPAAFKMGSEDLLVPAVRSRERLKVHVEMNTHGDIGHPQSGDLVGDAAGLTEPGASGIAITLDRIR
ncbi:MAG: hypothetical protein ACHQ2Z_03985 [Elusimicrobiota bacterium]